MTNVTVYKGTSKAGKEYKALKIEIGEWTQLYFPRTKFEMDYIEKVLKKLASDDSKFNLDEY